MRFITALAFLTASVAALPSEVQGGQLIDKRSTCQQMFPGKKCANLCCQWAGGCSSLNCADSYCTYFNIGQPECECKCHYG